MPARPSFVALALAAACLSVVNAFSQTPQITKSMPVFPDGHNTPLGQQVHELLRDPAVSRAHWGIAVTTLQGVPVFGLDEGKLFRPASTAKLFTMAAALALLGPDYRFHTKIYGELDSATGTVHGDLTLLGGGDPSFGTEDLPYRRFTADAGHQAHKDDSLDTLVDAIVKAGVRQVTGQIVGDDSLFETAVAPEGWAAEDLLWGYGTLPNALAVGDNELAVTVTSEAEATVDQLYPYLKVVNGVQVLPAAQGRKSDIDAQAIRASPQEVRLYGTITPGTRPITEHLAIDDPALYAAGALQALLMQRGTRLDGEAVARHAPILIEPQPFLAGLRASGCEGSLWSEGPACVLHCAESSGAPQMIAEHLSHPLVEDVAFTLKTSANVHAEMLLHHLGLRASCPGVTTLQGARVLRAWLLHIGLEEGDVQLYDGSGLSAKDLVTPRAETQVLAWAASQPWFPQWMAALPVGGVDGTLAARFTEAPLKGQVFAKTGTLGETRALAGYVQAATGKQMIFSILVDNHEPGSSADRAVMDKIVAAIAQFN